MIRSALPLRQNETARRSAREIPRDMGAKPPRQTRKKQVEHELRSIDGDALLVAVTLPAGETLEWDPPVVTPRNPAQEVGLYIDGVLVARGFWPNLENVDA